KAETAADGPRCGDDCLRVDDQRSSRIGWRRRPKSPDVGVAWARKVISLTAYPGSTRRFIASSVIAGAVRIVHPSSGDSVWSRYAAADAYTATRSRGLQRSSRGLLPLIISTVFGSRRDAMTAAIWPRQLRRRLLRPATSIRPSCLVRAMRNRTSLS